MKINRNNNNNNNLPSDTASRLVAKTQKSVATPTTKTLVTFLCRKSFISFDWSECRLSKKPE